MEHGSSMRAMRWGLRTLVLLVLAAATAAAANGATSTVEITADVLGVTTVNAAGCTGTAIAFDTVLPEDELVTDECEVEFSGNVAASLRIRQTDRSGAALTSLATETLDASLVGDSGTDSGTTSLPVLTASDVAYAAAPLQNGGIVLTGRAAVGASSDVFVVVLEPDGSRDSSFDGDGIATLDVGGTGTDDVGFGVAVQADGKIVVAGESGAKRFFLARWNADGSLDTTGFGAPDGYVIDTAAPFGTWASAWDLLVQPDGKLVTSGYVNQPAPNRNRFFVARHNADGTRDLQFGGAGTGVHRSNVGSATGHSEAYDIQLGPNGSLVAVGYGQPGLPTGPAYATVLKLDASGRPDPLFSNTGVDGVARNDIDGLEGAMFGVTVASDGSVIASGGIDVAGVTKLAALRWESDGSVDVGFGDDGIAIPAGAVGESQAYDVELLPDGDVIVAGMDNYGVDRNVAVARLNADGSEDGAWGTGGVVSWDPGVSDGARAAFLQDGQVVVAGYAGNATTDLAVMRFGATAIPDHSGSNDWTAGDGMFGACVTGVGGTATHAGWLQGTCGTSNEAAWNDVPRAPQLIAQKPVGPAGTARVVFGLRVPSNEPSGMRYAPVTFEVVPTT